MPFTEPHPLEIVPKSTDFDEFVEPLNDRIDPLGFVSSVDVTATPLGTEITDFEESSPPATKQLFEVHSVHGSVPHEPSFSANTPSRKTRNILTKK